VAFVTFVFVADLSVANAAIPTLLRWDRGRRGPRPFVMYPHIFQSWSMFSPDAPLATT